MIGGNQRLRFGDRIRFGNRGVLLLLLAALLSSPIGAEDKPVRDIGSRLELFLDDYLIGRLQGARLKLHKPRSKGVVLRFDEPWEGEFSGFPRIVDDSGTYRMYYRGLPPWKKGEPLTESTCVAVSRDGIHWEKPDVGRIELLGSTRNNAVFPGSGFAPFLDTRPGVPTPSASRLSRGLPGWRPRSGSERTSPPTASAGRGRTMPTRANGWEASSGARWKTATSSTSGPTMKAATN